MNTTTLIALIGGITALLGTLLGTGGVIAWRKAEAEKQKLKAEERKASAEADSVILRDLNAAYVRVCDELAQTTMRLVACEVENEQGRKRVEKLQGLYEISMVARARAHLAIKALGNYELHIDYLLDEMRHHNIPITPEMRTQKLRTAYQAQQERLDAMEIPELELLLKETPPN
jgi:hypothetical protein